MKAAMKRRNFLGLIGAAAAVPLMPIGASAAGYSRASYLAAVAHAGRFPMVSIGGMVKRLGVTTDQAEAILNTMNNEGLVNILAKPSQRNGIHAASKILKGDHWGLIRTAQAQSITANTNATRLTPEQVASTPDINPMMAHLYDLCRAEGIVLNDRCLS